MEFVSDGDVLVAEYVRESAESLVRLDNPGLPIWLIIDSARTIGFDAERVAARYGLSERAVSAAFTYYEQNKPLIDAQISTCIESYS